MGHNLTLHPPPSVKAHGADRRRRFSARRLSLALVSALSLGLPLAAHAASGEFLLDGNDSLALTLQEAIDQPGDHHITLLKNLDIAGGLVVSGKTIHFALDGHDLTLSNAAGAGMQVNGGGAVDYTGAGSFTASSTAGDGLTVEDGNSSAELTGASTNTGGAYAVHANGKVTVTVRGDVAAAGNLDMGIKAENGAEVNVTGQVTAADASAIVAEHGGTSVTVAGDAHGTRPIDASGGAIVTVGGNATAGGGNAIGIGAPIYIAADGANKIGADSGTLIAKAASGWQWPIKDNRVTQAWCHKSSDPNRRDRPYHLGRDMKGPSDSILPPVLAAAAGTVASAGYNSANGNYVILQHSSPAVYSFYAHLSNISVKTGSKVTKGQQIGIMGNTGASTGAHLHFAFVSSLSANGGYYGYADKCSGDKVTYDGRTYYKPAYVIDNGKLP